MLLLDQLAEQYIEQARDRGELNNLPGAGRPLPEDSAMGVCEEERMAYRILKNAGYIPPELELHKEAVNLAMQIETAVPKEGDKDECSANLLTLLERLSRVNLLLAERGCTRLIVPSEYLHKLA